MPARPGPNNLITDVGGLLVGQSHDADARTGVTVIRPIARAVAGVAVGGGGPGTRETDALAPDTLVDAVDAIVLSGGSVYGLAAADGVTAALGAAGQGYALSAAAVAAGAPPSPVVPSAILYDLANGGNKKWGETPPYRALGMAALKDAKVEFALGRVGAGFGARAGADQGGIGSASVVAAGGVVVGALAAVNSHGAVRMPGTDAFWAWPYEQEGEFGGARPGPGFSLDLDDWGAAKTNPGAAAGRANTTVCVVATNIILTPTQATRVAKMAQAGIARAVRPAFAPFDGDVVFCLSMGQAPLAEPHPLELARIGELAAACLARAIARGVHLAR